jgi:hypothetical protein
MNNVVIFLRTALFTYGGEQGHVPAGATVIEGRILDEKNPGGALVETAKFLDDRGRKLGEQKVTIVLPWSKVDHVLVRDTTPT